MDEKNAPGVPFLKSCENIVFAAGVEDCVGAWTVAAF